MARKPRPSTATPEGLAKRMHVFRHNALMGHCSMSMRQMAAIEAAASTCPETKAKARYIRRQLEALNMFLKATRIDPAKEQA